MPAANGDKRDRAPGFGGTPLHDVTLPEVGAECADTHAHLDMLDDPAGALARAGDARLSLVASVVDLTEEPERTLQGLDGWRAQAGPGAPDVVLIAGVHPHNASRWTTELDRTLRELVARDTRVRGIGEVGLDFHYDHSPRDAQRHAMREQLELAAELGLPVTVHLREAHAEGLELLAPYATRLPAVIIHCFTEGPELAREFLALGESVYISFAGPVTFGKGQQVREAAAVVPLERVLVETDAPFLAPAPYRGRPNEPAFCLFNAVVVAEAMGVEPSVVASAVAENARRIFGGA